LLSIEQERFFQQLAFRIPSIKEGTTLLTEDILFPSHGIFPTASAINLLYLSGPAESRVIPVWMYSLYPRLADRSPTAGPVSFHTNFRVWNFDGISTKALLLQYGLEKQNCLWVLSPNDHDNPDLPPLTRRWLSVSDLNRIDPTSPDGWVFNPQLFGEPSLKSWCYYFENADLARQTENWEAGADLADNALDAGFSISASGSNNPFEWLPFMEAYAQKGRWQDAARIAIEGYNWDPDYQEMLCNRWQGWLAIDTNPTDKENATLQVQETLGCTFLP
jgi:hypothetical protein